jgi:pyruvate dehydrogenase E1 component alpha subunit
MSVDQEELFLYRQMVRIRAVEEEIASRYPQGEMRCPVHLSIGQEAVAVGVCTALRTSDQIVSTHRCHAHYLAKGGNLPAMIAEIYGRATGCCGGRGGSMHLFDDAAGVMCSLPIVGSSIPIAVGSALAAQMRGDDEVTVVLIGDAAIEEGAFHESANFAALRKLPVIFVCENNLYAVYTNIEQRQPPRPLTRLSEPFGMPSFHGDGNDVLAVKELTEQAVTRARSGDGPTFLVLDTYRWREHCGPAFDNHIGYRAEAEFLAWQKKCPINRLHGRLADAGAIEPAIEAKMKDEIEREIAEAFSFTQESGFPDAGTAGDFVYA